MKILIVSPSAITKNMAGPSIRYFQFYKELSRLHDVVMLVPKTPELLIQYDITSNKSIKKWLGWCDVIVTQGLSLFHYPILKATKKPLVIDLYDPFILENLEIRNDNYLGNVSYCLDLTILREQLKRGDYFICSNERQLHYWAGCLSINGLINPKNYKKNSKVRDLIGLVPFGIPSEEPVSSKKSIRDLLNLDLNDLIIVWGGGVWKWLDIEAVINAFSQIQKLNLHIKLYIMGASGNEELIEQLKKLDLLNKSVYLGNWIPYEERHHYYMDADIGIITHFNNWETEFSHRTRLLDYIWCNLPVISTEGDYMSKFAQKNGFGVTVEAGNVEQLVEEIVAFYYDRARINIMKQKIQVVKPELTWELAVKPLENFCADPQQRPKNKIPFYALLFQHFLATLKRIRYRRNL